MPLLLAISTLGGFFLAKDEKEDFGKTFFAGTGALAVLSLAIIGFAGETVEDRRSHVGTRWAAR